MATFSSITELKKYLISSQLVRADQWTAVESGLVNGESVEEVLKIMERGQILTSLQTTRILKGTTEGLVLGNYKLLYRNASGSFARVYRAESLDGKRTVAVKLLRDRWAVDPDAVLSFEREARICQRFKHPNIVPIYEVGSDGRFHFFTMEFIEGGNLRDFLRVRKSVAPAEAAQYTYQICSGLEYALEKGATHRDLKLTNVLMSSNGTVKLVDFGLAGAETADQAGTSDEVHRALEYASLEKGTHAPSNDPRSDLFFAGAIMYELLSGRPAWPRTRDREERKDLARYTNTPPVETIRPGIPDSIVSIVSQMMQVNPNDRYQSATEVIADLRAALIELGEWEEESEEIELPFGEGRKFDLLVVDSVKKRVQALESYFSKYAFDVSFIAHPAAAFERVKGDNPPDGLLVLADNFADDVISEFPQVQAYARQKKVPCLAVFPRDAEDQVNKAIRSTKYGKTAFQPATLREIRTHFEEMAML